MTDMTQREQTWIKSLRRLRWVFLVTAVLGPAVEIYAWSRAGQPRWVAWLTGVVVFLICTATFVFLTARMRYFSSQLEQD